jgi:hypothetical protein
MANGAGLGESLRGLGEKAAEWVETPPFRSDGERSDRSDSCIGGGGQRRAAHAGKTVD